MKNRFMSKVTKVGTCWKWGASMTAGGYGKFSAGTGEWRLAHRVSYELFVGPISKGMQIDHLCRNTWCVNPEHLEAVTGRVNVLRGNTMPAKNAAKTHCKNGHELNDENAYRFGRKRLCRICRAAAEQRRRDKLVAETGVSYLKHDRASR